MLRTSLVGILAVSALTSLPGAAAGQETIYGAFAFSQNRLVHTFSGPRTSQVEAEGAALESCRLQANDCVLTNHFFNACGALATAPDGSWGASWGETDPVAREKAMGFCARHSTECFIRVVQCVGSATTVSPPMIAPQMN